MRNKKYNKLRRFLSQWALLLGGMLVIGIALIETVFILPPQLSCPPDISISRIAFTNEEKELLNYVEELNWVAITGYTNPNPGGKFVLNNQTLKDLLSSRTSSCRSEYTLHWKVQLSESEGALLNSSSFEKNTPNWIKIYQHAAFDKQYLAWWDTNGTRYNDSISVPFDSQLHFGNQSLSIKWVYAGYLYYHVGRRNPPTPHAAGHRYKIYQLTFLDEERTVVCFAISSLFYYD